MKLTEKTILITGASSGIGLEITRQLAGEGANVVMAARNLNKLERAAGSLEAEGFTPIVVPTDITREADCRAVVQAAIDAFGGLDVLVNNAGYGPPASLLDTTEDIWDATLDVSLKGVYLMTRAAVPAMLKQGGGTVISISSVAGKYGLENRSAYCAAKWGLQGFTEALRAELDGQNIRTHLVCPGAVATPWWGSTNDAQPGEVLERMIQPEEVAEAVHWLLTKPARLQIDEIVIKTHRSPWA